MVPQRWTGAWRGGGFKQFESGASSRGQTDREHPAPCRVTTWGRESTTVWGESGALLRSELSGFLLVFSDEREEVPAHSLDVDRAP